MAFDVVYCENVGEAVFAAEGAKVGRSDGAGMYIGLLVALTPSIKGAEVVGVDVGAWDGLVEGWPVGIRSKR